MDDTAAPGGPLVGAFAVLHGRHPLRGYAVTWRLTPLAAARQGLGFLVERADGHIEDDRVWELAEKETALMTSTEVSRLVRRWGRPAVP